MTLKKSTSAFCLSLSFFLAAVIPQTAEAKLLGSSAATCKVSGQSPIAKITIYLLNANDVKAKTAYSLEEVSGGTASFLYQSKLELSETSGAQLSYTATNGRVRKISLDAQGKGQIDFGDGFKGDLNCN